LSAQLEPQILAEHNGYTRTVSVILLVLVSVWPPLTRVVSADTIQVLILFGAFTYLIVSVLAT